MNFLSHYYFERHLSDSNRIVGSVLPDLVKNARKDWNLRPEKYPDIFHLPEHRSILEGWKKHLAVDKHFHNSDFFNKHTSELRQLIAPLLVHSVVRPSFLAHIALELMLDSLLLTRNKLDSADLYLHLEESSHDSISSFLEKAGIDDVVHFTNFFQNFIKHQYLDSYREADQIMYALNRICMRVWQNPLNETQILQLGSVLMAYHEQLQDSYMVIFEEIEREIPH